MCLGEICEVVGLEEGGKLRVKSVTREQVVSPMAIEGGVEVGDWLVVHSGFALGKLTPEEAREALALRATDPGSLEPTEVPAPAAPAPKTVPEAGTPLTPPEKES